MQKADAAISGLAQGLCRILIAETVLCFLCYCYYTTSYAKTQEANAGFFL